MFGGCTLVKARTLQLLTRKQRRKMSNSRSIAIGKVKVQWRGSHADYDVYGVTIGNILKMNLHLERRSGRSTQQLRDVALAMNGAAAHRYHNNKSDVDFGLRLLREAKRNNGRKMLISRLAKFGAGGKEEPGESGNTKKRPAEEQGGGSRESGAKRRREEKERLVQRLKEIEEQRQAASKQRDAIIFQWVRLHAKFVDCKRFAKKMLEENRDATVDEIAYARQLVDSVAESLRGFVEALTQNWTAGVQEELSISSLSFGSTDNDKYDRGNVTRTSSTFFLPFVPHRLTKDTGSQSEQAAFFEHEQQSFADQFFDENRIEELSKGKKVPLSVFAMIDKFWQRVFSQMPTEHFPVTLAIHFSMTDDEEELSDYSLKMDAEDLPYSQAYLNKLAVQRTTSNLPALLMIPAKRVEEATRDRLNELFGDVKTNAIVSIELLDDIHLMSNAEPRLQINIWRSRATLLGVPLDVNFVLDALLAPVREGEPAEPGEDFAVLLHYTPQSERSIIIQLYESGEKSMQDRYASVPEIIEYTISRDENVEKAPPVRVSRGTKVIESESEEEEKEAPRFEGDTVVEEQTDPFQQHRERETQEEHIEETTQNETLFHEQRALAMYENIKLLLVSGLLQAEWLGDSLVKLAKECLQTKGKLELRVSVDKDEQQLKKKLQTEYEFRTPVDDLKQMGAKILKIAPEMLQTMDPNNASVLYIGMLLGNLDKRTHQFEAIGSRDFPAHPDFRYRSDILNPNRVIGTSKLDEVSPLALEWPFVAAGARPADDFPDYAVDKKTGMLARASFIFYGLDYPSMRHFIEAMPYDQIENANEFIVTFDPNEQQEEEQESGQNSRTLNNLVEEMAVFADAKARVKEFLAEGRISEDVFVSVYAMAAAARLLQNPRILKTFFKYRDGILNSRVRIITPLQLVYDEALQMIVYRQKLAWDTRNYVRMMQMAERVIMQHLSKSVIPAVPYPDYLTPKVQSGWQLRIYGACPTIYEDFKLLYAGPTALPNEGEMLQLIAREQIVRIHSLKSPKNKGPFEERSQLFDAMSKNQASFLIKPGPGGGMRLFFELWLVDESEESETAVYQMDSKVAGGVMTADELYENSYPDPPTAALRLPMIALNPGFAPLKNQEMVLKIQKAHMIVTGDRYILIKGASIELEEASTVQEQQKQIELLQRAELLVSLTPEREEEETTEEEEEETEEEEESAEEERQRIAAVKEQVFAGLSEEEAENVRSSAAVIIQQNEKTDELSEAEIKRLPVMEKMVNSVGTVFKGQKLKSDDLFLFLSHSYPFVGDADKMQQMLKTFGELADENGQPLKFGFVFNDVFCASVTHALLCGLASLLFVGLPANFGQMPLEVLLADTSNFLKELKRASKRKSNEKLVEALNLKTGTLAQLRQHPLYKIAVRAWTERLTQNPILLETVQQVLQADGFIQDFPETQSQPFYAAELLVALDTTEIERKVPFSKHLFLKKSPFSLGRLPVDFMPITSSEIRRVSFSGLSTALSLSKVSEWIASNKEFRDGLFQEDNLQSEYIDVMRLIKAVVVDNQEHNILQLRKLGVVALDFLSFSVVEENTEVLQYVAVFAWRSTVLAQGTEDAEKIVDLHLVGTTVFGEDVEAVVALGRYAAFIYARSEFKKGTEKGDTVIARELPELANFSKEQLTQLLEFTYEDDTYNEAEELEFVGRKVYVKEKEHASYILAHDGQSLYGSNFISLALVDALQSYTCDTSFWAQTRFVEPDYATLLDNVPFSALEGLRAEADKRKVLFYAPQPAQLQVAEISTPKTMIESGIADIHLLAIELWVIPSTAVDVHMEEQKLLYRTQLFPANVELQLPGSDGRARLIALLPKTTKHDELLRETQVASDNYGTYQTLKEEYLSGARDFPNLSESQIENFEALLVYDMDTSDDQKTVNALTLMYEKEKAVNWPIDQQQVVDANVAVRVTNDNGPGYRQIGSVGEVVSAWANETNGGFDPKTDVSTVSRVNTLGDKAAANSIAVLYNKRSAGIGGSKVGWNSPSVFVPLDSQIALDIANEKTEIGVRIVEQQCSFANPNSIVFGAKHTAFDTEGWSRLKNAHLYRERLHGEDEVQMLDTPMLIEKEHSMERSVFQLRVPVEKRQEDASLKAKDLPLVKAVHFQVHSTNPSTVASRPREEENPVIIGAMFLELGDYAAPL